jgi:hypothetical protein
MKLDDITLFPEILITRPFVDQQHYLRICGYAVTSPITSFARCITIRANNGFLQAEHMSGSMYIDTLLPCRWSPSGKLIQVGDPANPAYYSPLYGYSAVTHPYLIAACSKEIRYRWGSNDYPTHRVAL